VTGLRQEITGKEETLAILGQAAEHYGHPRPLFDAIGGALVVSTQQRFEEEKEPGGDRWPASYRAMADGGKTLTDSGRLVRSITHNATDDGVEVGTDVIYAAIQQLGGIVRAKTKKGLRFRVGGRNGSWVTKQSVFIPARPFLGLDAEDEKDIRAISEQWIAKPWASAIDGDNDLGGVSP
jgi:phage virion morphogenesis protein